MQDRAPNRSQRRIHRQGAHHGPPGRRKVHLGEDWKRARWNSRIRAFRMSKQEQIMYADYSLN